MNLLARARLSEWALLLLLTFSILWKGGKSLEATWLMAILAGSLTILYWLIYGVRKRDEERAMELRQGMSVQRQEVPFWLWVIGFLYIACSIASYIFSQTRNYGLDEVLRTASYVLIFLWVARMRIEQESTALETWLPRIIAWSAAAAGLIGVAVYTLQPVNRFVGTFFDYRFTTDYWPNAWAQFLLVAFPLSLLVAWRYAHEKNKWWMFALPGFVLSTLFLSYSRGAMLALVGEAGIAIVLFVTVMFRDIRYRRIIRTILLATLLRAVLVLGLAFILFLGVNKLRSMYFDVQSVSQKVTFTAAEGTSSINERSQFWNQAFELAKERPFIGWGPYSFRIVQPALMQNVLATSDHPHNIILKFWMERGLFAALAFSGIFGSVLFIAIFSFFAKRKANSADKDVLTIACICAIVGILLHNMIDFNLQFVGVGLSVILCLGLLVPSVTSSSESAASFGRWRIRRLFSRIDLLLSALVLFVVLWEGYFLGISSLGRHALAVGNSEQALQWFGYAHGALFSRDMYLSEAQVHMNNRDFVQAKAALDRYENINALDPRLWQMRGDLAMRMGDWKAAKDALETAYMRGRYSGLGIMNMLLPTLRKTDSRESLIARKEEFDTLFTDYAEAIEHNTHFIALSPSVEELQSVSLFLALMYPSDAERYKAIADEAVKHATEERTKFKARTNGFLW